MQVIDRKVSISVDCLSFGAEMAGLPLPSLLAPEPPWRSPDAQLSYRYSAKKALAAEGLWHGGSPTEEFAGTLSVLGRGGREFSAVVESPNAQYWLHVAASGRDAVFAGYLPSSGQVRLRPARTHLPRTSSPNFPRPRRDQVRGFRTRIRPASGHQRCVAPPGGAACAGAGRASSRRRWPDLCGLPRRPPGLPEHRKQLLYLLRHRAGAVPVLFHREPGFERYVNVAQGRPETMIAKTYELLDHLR